MTKEKSKKISFERINEVQNRLEKTGSGMILKWTVGKGFRLFTLTSAKFQKKPANSLTMDQANSTSSTKGKVNFGLSWSFFKRTPFKIESYASLNFKYLIENQILMQKFYNLTEDPFGQITFDGLSLSINLNF